jgi:hypothetical protein
MQGSKAVTSSSSPEPTLIEPSLVEGVLVDAFPGVDLYKSEAIGRRKVFKVEFSEFTLTVTTPEHSGMKGKTSFQFQRRIEYTPDDPRARKAEILVFRVAKSFNVDEGEQLLTAIRRARGYVMGIVMALQQAFQEGGGGPIANLFG